jgi:outer membrane protein TolC
MAQMDDRVAQGERLLVTAKSQLARWVGDAASAPLADPPNTDTINLSEAHLDSQLLHHPQIALMIRQEEVAQTDVSLAQANTKSDWSVELMFSQRGPAFSNMMSVNLAVPLQWDQKNRQGRELAAKQATVEQLKAEREDALRAHAAEVRAMLQERRSNRERLRRYDEAILPLAAERTKAALTAYRGGVSLMGALSMVLDARRAEVEIQIERLRLEMDTARLWAQLNFLTGSGE